MILNNAKKFVFIHVPKTGGSSIRAVLSGLPGNSPEDCHPSTKHETWQQFKNRKGSDIPGLDSFFKFGFVRNPWDKNCSLYRYLVAHRPRPEIDSVRSFSEFVLRIGDRLDWIMSLHSMRPQVDYFTNGDGEVAADHIGRYESLRTDYRAIMVRLNLDLALPHENKSPHFGRDFRKDYTDRDSEIVAVHFQADLRMFHYQFDPVAKQSADD